jgi:uncharacterized protein (TIGR02270 family)
MAAQGPVLWDVVEEHLDEAAFLSGQWEAALASPRRTLASVAAGPEERLRAHLDGLLVAGPAARGRLLDPALAGDDAGKVFAAALAFLESPGRECFDRVATRLDAAAPVVRALELARRPGIDRELLALAASGDPRRVAAALDALAFRRVPVPPEIVLQAGAAQAVAVRPAALRAARLAGPRVLGFVDRALASPVAAVRDAALETGLVLGLRSAWTACQKAAAARQAGARFPLLALALGGEASDADAIVAALAVEELRPAALFALGFTGRVVAADACLAHLRDADVGRLAAEAFSAITGLAIEGEYRAAEPPPQAEPVPLEQEDLDADLVPGPEAALPLPAAEAVEAWWKGARARFDARTRYLAGKPYDAGSALAAFVAGPMRRRHAVGLDLAIRSKGEYAVQTRGWAADQLRFQGEHRLAPRSDFDLPFGKLLRG